jgi:hypothetical protein
VINQEPLVNYGDDMVLDLIWVGEAVYKLVQTILCKEEIQEPVMSAVE